MKVINIDAQSTLPKYKQIIFSVEVAIAEKRLKRNDKLPSVNKISLEFSISRDTVLLAFDELKKRGIIYSILGKGYYVKSVEFNFEQRFFLLFDELNIFKEDIYNSFLKTISNKAQVDIFFHHFNIDTFRKLISESNGNYSKYIVMPTNLSGAASIIKMLPENDVYILDQTNDQLQEYPSVHQNFVKDMYDSLFIGKDKLNNYEKLILIFPGFKEPIGMVEGFKKFCDDYTFSNEIISSFEGRTVQKGTVYIIPDDRHLVAVLEQAKVQQFQIVADFGIISYNDTPLKKVVESGITTISTNFSTMGMLLASMILENRKEKVENKCDLIVRNSL
ncbi:GntR family transcriptional regulator [Flavobacterium sp. 25HG05S-40]|uniref:GntR family transcriptional regulator n=1 Tax=Flavobacterium sp. 25HG05S-40 TaxID=3458682 RepID=UPI004044FD04